MRVEGNEYLPLFLFSCPYEIPPFPTTHYPCSAKCKTAEVPFFPNRVLWLKSTGWPIPCTSLMSHQGDCYRLVDPVTAWNRCNQKKKTCGFSSCLLGEPVVLWPNFLVHKLGVSNISPIHLPVLSGGSNERLSGSVFVSCELPVEGEVHGALHPFHQLPFTFRLQGCFGCVLFPD